MRGLAVGSSVTETVVNRSRFVCSLFRVGSEAEARERIAAHRREFWEATHHCTAYVFDGGRIARSNDDGEPAGTAGLPMLEVLRGRDLTDTLAVVTRYFGGVKLGAGGLVRAYGGAVSAAVDAAGVVELAVWPRLLVRVDYGVAGSLEGLLRLREDVRLAHVSFTDVVTFDLACADAELLAAWVAGQSAGAAEIEPAGSVRVEL
ncbi:IMPACT family protein [Glycomyces artemisiae]|uniref:Putative YigZ family protein n=1 Tax=Glycomyces artemisiae TaxID=1076443 RepID=A0A2T0UFZ3_9ACTN|nr:YigZ family protein [Glycomyces artemisiae]PRY56870.1 putative YigZ family protein [Glycomyces artemisiae]